MERSVTMDPYRFHMDSLENAGKMLEKFMTMDNSFPSYAEMTQVLPQGVPTTSGLNDMDYPNVSELTSVKQVTVTNKVPLPQEVMEHFGHIQCHCMMGLFPDINRAWLTIDSDIYIWTYERGTDMACFDGLGETIVGVGLVKPKPGVFHNFVRYLLILTTTVEIVILGVTFSMTNDGNLGRLEEMHLLPDPVFVLPTDGVAVTTIVGTNHGRIFFGGRDGSLYEVAYQAAGTWFGKRCKKVNHSTSMLSFLVPSFLNLAFGEEDPITQISVDNSRHILFTLTEKGSIEVFDLGEDGNSMGRVTGMGQATIMQHAINIVKTLDGSTFRHVVSINAIEASESPHFNLVAVTSTGVRLYFTTTSVTNPALRPYTLHLVHVRLPPGYAANAPLPRPSVVRMAHYKSGNLILVTSPGNDQDVLWSISSDLFPFHPYLVEVQTVVPLDGAVWAMAEVPGVDLQGVLPSLSGRPEGSLVADPPLMVRQHAESPRKYILLTAQGVDIFLKRRPVDLLRELLSENRGPEAEAVKRYFVTQKEEQACATALILACLQNTQNLQVADWATRAFFLYGGEAKMTSGVSVPASPAPFQYTMSPGFNPPIVSTPYIHGANTSQNISMTMSEPMGRIVQHSARHNGLYLYMGRILRPLWNLRVVARTTQDNMVFLCSSIKADECMWILGYLAALRSFLERNTQFAGSGALNLQSVTHQTLYNSFNNTTVNTSISQRTTARTADQEAQLEEKRSLDALKLFLGHTCEVLGLWKILCEHQFHVIASCLNREHQSQLQLATFRNLVLGGHELCTALINSLINRYLNDNASVDSISTKLREVCPNLYRNEDAACSKANEMLLNAKLAKNMEERQEKLNTALQLCKDVAPNINLPLICQLFCASQFHEGVLDLCLTYAAKIDPSNTGYHYYKNKEPPEDVEGYQIYIKRMECYKEVTAALDQLIQQRNPSPHSPVSPDEDATPSETEQKGRRLIQAALTSEDELCHMAVYEWMMGKCLNSELMAMAEPSLETYLVRAAEQNPDAVYISDLLWKYYEKNQNHAAAAKVLHKLATQPGNSLSLQQRIEYLARAIMCMSSEQVGYAPQLGVFLKELEDIIDVARIQQQILDAISKLKDRHPLAEDAIVRLNSSLMVVTKLYEEYANPFNLWESKLAIIHCAGYNDSTLVEVIWTNIIDSELRACPSIGANDKMAVLMSKVKALGQKHAAAPHCFPIAFLVKLLEAKACQLKADPGYVHATMLKLGVSYVSLLDIYDRLITANDRVWLTEGNEFHLIEAVASLVENFVMNPPSMTAIERRSTKAKASDVISNCLAILYSKPDIAPLIQRLRGIHAKVNRL